MSRTELVVEIRKWEPGFCEGSMPKKRLRAALSWYDPELDDLPATGFTMASLLKEFLRQLEKSQDGAEQSYDLCSIHALEGTTTGSTPTHGTIELVNTRYKNALTRYAEIWNLHVSKCNPAL